MHEFDQCISKINLRIGNLKIKEDFNFEDIGARFELKGSGFYPKEISASLKSDGDVSKIEYVYNTEWSREDKTRL